MTVPAEFDDRGKLFRRRGRGIARSPAVMIRMKAGKQSLRMIGTQQIFVFQRNRRIRERRSRLRLPEELFAPTSGQSVPFRNGSVTKLPVLNELLP